MQRFYIIFSVILAFALSGCDFCSDENSGASEAGDRIYFTAISANRDENTTFYYESQSGNFDSFLDGYSLNPTYSDRKLLFTLLNDDGFYDLKYFDFAQDSLFDISNGDAEFPNLNANISSNAEYILFTDSSGVIYKSDLSTNFEIIGNNADIDFGLFISPDDGKLLFKNKISKEYEIISKSGDLISTFNLPNAKSEIRFNWNRESDGFVFAENDSAGIFGRIKLDGQKKEYKFDNFNPLNCFYFDENTIGLGSLGGGIFLFDQAEEKLIELETRLGFNDIEVEYNSLENKLTVLQTDDNKLFSLLWIAKLDGSEIIEKEIVSSGVINFLSRNGN
jgi:hypothetical protein